MGEEERPSIFQKLDEADAMVSDLLAMQRDASEAPDLRKDLAKARELLKTRDEEVEQLKKEIEALRLEKQSAITTRDEAEKLAKFWEVKGTKLADRNIELEAELAKYSGAAQEIQQLQSELDHAAERRQGDLRYTLALIASQSGLLFAKRLATAHRENRTWNFCPVSPARNATVSDDGVTVNRTNPGKPWDGVCLSTKPIPTFLQGHYFAVRIVEVDARFQAGLGLGVIPEQVALQTLGPKGHCPAASCDFPAFTFCSYYGGQLRKKARFFAGGSGDERETDWKPQELVAGDEVGFLAKADGTVDLFVNGKPRVSVPDAGVTVGVPLKAVIEVLGHTIAVEVVHGAEPPIEAGDLLSVLRLKPGRGEVGAMPSATEAPLGGHAGRASIGALGGVHPADNGVLPQLGQKLGRGGSMPMVGSGRKR
eukprot:gnl/MRDRNA2_/MRDRNA2_121631_c0_seq1.p1 gnl/MRDRNA2_/MRDRNA2_121631_c0~~gnl/MRDRNA2_/MRDRNA2_121631_c0_seq1.p1  ORF type:complete len:424 (-),score=103.64 gnl/MRDRNA2_/MRDRNA2_121631_c0_seq1:107-1378(-)